MNKQNSNLKINLNEMNFDFDKIKSSRDKYLEPTDDLIETLHTQFLRMSENTAKRETHLEELNATLQKLKCKVSAADESLKTEKKIVNEKVQEMLAANVHLKELEGDRNALLKEVHDMETQKNELKNLKPNVKDMHTLEHGKKKFEYYKSLTGIRWDFAAPEGTTKGYVTNRKDHIHTFNYQDKECGSKLSELMWKEVEKGAGPPEAKDSDNKENYNK